MTDTLRTRIAAALERNLAEQLFSDLPDRYYKWIGYDELADAVIRELDAACEGGCMWQIPDRFEDMTPQQRESLERDKR